MEASPAPSRVKPQPQQQLAQLVPPLMFGMVERCIYRTNALIPANLPFIKQLQLKTVVRLSPEVPMPVETKFFEENNIVFIHLGLKAWRPDATYRPVTEELIKESLEKVLDKNTHPILLECTSGVHQTGTVVGCLRRLQNWNITSILGEYRNFSGLFNTRYQNDQFIELFDTELITLPPELPDWFEEHREMMKRETRLKRNNSSAAITDLRSLSHQSSNSK